MIAGPPAKEHQATKAAEPMFRFPKLNPLPPLIVEARTPAETLTGHLVMLLHWADEQGIVLEECLVDAEQQFLQQIGEK